MSRWIVTSPGPAGVGDGIADYAARLAGALGSESAGLHLDGTALPTRESCAGLLLQYSPSACSATLRGWARVLLRDHVPVVMTVHEFWPPADGTPRRALRRWQLHHRLRRLARYAAGVVVTQEVAARELVLTGVLARTPTIIPVGSNIAMTASATRRDGGLVVFGQPASYDLATLRAVDGWRRAQTPEVPLTWVSRSLPELQAAWARVGDMTSAVTLLGGVPEAHVSALLARATIGLAPYVGGASGRRTTLAAMLEHGVPCVTFDGPAADQWLSRSGAVRLVAPEPASFVGAVDALWRSADDRDRLSTAARRAHADRLTWTAIATAYRVLMTSAQKRPS